MAKCRTDQTHGEGPSAAELLRPDATLEVPLTPAISATIAEAKRRMTPTVPLSIELHVAEFRPAVHLHDHIEVRLDPAQKIVLRRLFDGLDAAGCRLNNGKRISGPPDVVRYVLERVAATGAFAGE